MAEVTIFAPSPTLTVTVEDHPSGGEIHVHAGGQGVWQARMLRRLDVDVMMCCVLTGETGGVLGHLLADEGFEVAAVERGGRGSVYIHDRRTGMRRTVAEEEGEPLGRHELDELYGITLREGLASGLVILSGPAGDDVLPSDTYRRLATDLRNADVRVIADLAGERQESAVSGGVDVLKVSLEELQAGAGRELTDVHALLDVMRGLCARGADTVIVSRGPDSVLLLDDHGALEIVPPRLEETDAHGAGDSLTSGVAAGMARGESPRDAVTLGAAAGALNVTRHGLGTGDAETIARLREKVEVRDAPELLHAEDDGPPAHSSLESLTAAANAESDEKIERPGSAP